MANIYDSKEPRDEFRWALPGDLGVHRMDDLRKSRRRKRIILPENALINCVMLSAAVPGDYVVKLSLDLPPGSVVLTRTYNVCEQGEELLVANEAWPELTSGEYPEIIRVKPEYVLVSLQQTRHPENISQPLIGKDGVTPLNLPFVIPMAEMEKISRIVANSILQGYVKVAPKERERAINFFNAILGSQAVTEAANFMAPEGSTYVPKFTDGSEVSKVVDAHGNVGYKVPQPYQGEVQGVEYDADAADEAEFFNTAFGEPHKPDRLAQARAAAQEIVDRRRSRQDDVPVQGIVNKDYDHGPAEDPFSKTWRDKEPLL